jgi:hypothetical protein
MMLAHGFTIEQMVELIRAGLATATAERVVAGGQKREVARLRVTEAGRWVLVGDEVEEAQVGRTMSHGETPATR